MTETSAMQLRKRRRLQRRRMHVKKKVYGTPERQRMVVYRSNRHIYVQIIDDINHRTIVGCSTLTPILREKISKDTSKIDQAKIVGEHIAALAKEKGVNKVSFDRNGRSYHGRAKALAEGARSGGIEF